MEILRTAMWGMCAVLSIFSLIGAIRAANGKETDIYLSKKSQERYYRIYDQYEILRFRSWFGHVEFVAYGFAAVTYFVGVDLHWATFFLLIPSIGQGYMNRSSRFRNL